VDSFNICALKNCLFSLPAFHVFALPIDHLKEPLDRYWQETDPRVKVLHATERGGLIKARLLGYETSTAPIVVFFDSHIECFPGEIIIIIVVVVVVVVVVMVIILIIIIIIIIIPSLPS
jgi:glycosyltransferase involved in cell wall biosynthesis